MEQLRQVDGPEGTIRYWLTRKRVRNLNLRLDSGGEIHVSIPWNCPLEQADRGGRPRRRSCCLSCPGPTAWPGCASPWTGSIP